jgi:hypothetical protein
VLGEADLVDAAARAVSTNGSTDAMSCAISPRLLRRCRW